MTGARPDRRSAVMSRPRTIATLAVSCALFGASCASAAIDRRGVALTTLVGVPPWTGTPGTGIPTAATLLSDLPTVPTTTTNTTPATTTTTTTTMLPSTTTTTTETATTNAPSTTITPTPTTTTTTTTTPATTTTTMPCAHPITTPADLLFAETKWELLPGAVERLQDDLAVAVAAATVERVEITGHTDSRHPRDDDAYNVTLSQNRADVVAFVVESYLHLDASAVSAVGLAYTQPVVDDGGPDPRTYVEVLGRQNRRVEIVVYTTTCDGATP